ncbi:bifunctional (p)ppGpp synthetase/guanosine-3',5'-bis(diphosphate) 3'-pyrophosphohydrolase [Thiotrichales bacterium 19S3-7]|nr:bifunctional (p)ppGpp synthetase/guanosine-3',5'-bis(diphosphate) 3'-pyrophosphohydrolase [Thiotrichales bacterium 19S3-7]MCF6800579.1 bifunctional (p)ppGpp synthetase/guanosine-3',5'-bis(diphosphate) 3'-pyrophosphohydrolase [Thiotrichales bacterium 19S3-11]
MVQITDKYRLTQEGYVEFDSWLEKVKSFYPKDQLNTISEAIDLSMSIGIDMPSNLGGNCFQVGVEIASILFDLEVDEQTIAAGLLFELYYGGHVEADLILERLGHPTLVILDGANNMAQVRMLQNQQSQSTQMDQFRRMMLSMIKDVRIVLVKLAERICLLRSNKYNWTENYKNIMAREILDIYAPLANRLGLFKLKWEMEDRAFLCLYPVAYKKIAKQLNRKRLERESYLNSCIEQLNSKLAESQIRNFEVSGRVKHIYSIWRKLKNKNLNFDDLYDIRALRILVDTIADCYNALAIVHAKWQPIPSEFSDYIATPKANGYQSIHTVVYGPDQRILEVQIRTFEMHQASEMGVAAHWRYKEGVKYDPSFEARIEWMRSLLGWQKQLIEESDYLDHQNTKNIIEESVEDRVYVFTPEGDVLDLPVGSTPLDFAYYVHTMVGHRCRGAKVNGRIVNLTYQLKMSDRVQILTHKEPKPSLDWANQSLGFVHSAKIRARILRWFKIQNRQENAILGKDRLLNQLKNAELKQVDYEMVAEQFNHQDEESLFAAIETGDLRLNQVANYILEHFSRLKPQQDQEILKVVKSSAFSADIEKELKESDLVIYGIDNLLSHVAGCCKPVSGDEIIGYITQGRGVSVHRVDCKNMQRLRVQAPERVIDVYWGKVDKKRYVVDLLVTGYEKDQFSRGIFHLFSDQQVSVFKSELQLQKKDDLDYLYLRIAIIDTEHLKRIISQIKGLKGIVSVNRI